MKIRLFRRFGLAVAVLGALLLAAAPAGAATQTIDATLAASVTMSTSPTSTISSWTLASTGANTTSGGSVGVTANAPYIVTVQADKAKMTEYVTSTSSYVTPSPKTLAASLSLVPVLSSGTAVPVASLAVGTTASTLATGAGLGTDVMSLTLSQTTAVTDPALPSGRTYHIVLTYTASSTL